MLLKCNGACCSINQIKKKNHSYWGKTISVKYYECAYTHAHTHIYIHTYIHMYIQAICMCVHINLHTYIHTHKHAYLNTYVHTNIHTHTFILSYVLAYLHLYKHTYIHTFHGSIIVAKTVRCETSHKYTKIHDFYSVKHHWHFTKWYYKTSLYIENSSTEKRSVYLSILLQLL